MDNTQVRNVMFRATKIWDKIFRRQQWPFVMEDTFPLDLNIDEVSKHPGYFLCRYTKERKRDVLFDDPRNC